MKKERLDVLLVNNGFSPSRDKAKRTIMAGLVFINGNREDKSGTRFDPEVEITVKGQECPYVGRGGYKLSKALSTFRLDMTDNICMDIGSSTGGFTDCMLQNGAKKVYDIDVGSNQLAYKLRTDDRVVVMEKTNIRYLDYDLIKEPIDFISIDVSFISLRLVLPVAYNVLNATGKIVCLVKPQFEAGKDQVGKKGIIRDPEVHTQVLENVLEFAEENKLFPCGLTFSPITGAKGNVEYLLCLSKIDDGVIIDIDEIVNSSHKEFI
ncbi:MAG: TlyA family RNA methyltransferase [Peptostreptococcaceae bacterium]|nr:TlyA family RNA methyltransferase [Peptostreptococcaceae bacterium]